MRRQADTKAAPRPPSFCHRSSRRAGVAAVFVCVFLDVWLRVEPVLEYHTQFTPFLLRLSFLEPFLKRPGGLTDYGAAFLAQFNFHNWLGAAVFAGLLSTIYLTARLLIKRVTGMEGGIIALVPVFLLLALRNRDSVSALAVGLGLALALAISAGCLALPTPRSVLRLSSRGLGAVLLFYAAGLWAALVFVLLCSAGGIRGTGLPGWARRLRPRLLQSLPARRICGGLVILAGIAAIGVTYDQQRKTLAQIDYYSDQGQYDRLLSVARRAKKLDSAARIRVHWALYHTGRLSQDLFSFPNPPALEPLPGLRGGMASCRPQSRTFFEMGLVNEAEHLAHEALEWEGDRPDLLQLLAQVNVLMDRPKAAAVFLHQLGQMPFQRRSSRAALRNLKADPQLTSNPRLAEVLSRMMKSDVPHDGAAFASLAESLLDANPRNRMAFEYLMTYYLLTLDLKSLVARLGQLDTFGYVGIPRHYEEALLLYQRLNGMPPQLENRRIRPETLQRFKQFSEAMDQRLYNSPQGRKILERNFGDTFWYYFCASYSEPKPGVAKGREPAP